MAVATGRDAYIGSHDGKLRQQTLSIGVDSGPRQMSQGAIESPTALQTQDTVLGHREIQHQPYRMSVGRDMRQPLSIKQPRRQTSDVLPMQENAASHDRTQASEGFDKLRLPVPLNASKPQNLAGVDLKGQLHNNRPATLIAHM